MKVLTVKTGMILILFLSLFLSRNVDDFQLFSPKTSTSHWWGMLFSAFVILHMFTLKLELGR